jgi:hypothetical protein
MTGIAKRNEADYWLGAVTGIIMMGEWNVIVSRAFLYLLF